MNHPLVAVCLITYNHVAFIRDAIEGVLSQKTNFAFQLVVADDFSTDGTREILKEYQSKYPDLITLILQHENVGPLRNWSSLMTYPETKYIAYLEGDDYWQDPYKLQIQVDYMESDERCGMSFTNYDVLMRHARHSCAMKNTQNYYTDKFTLFVENYIVSSTVVMRRSIFLDALNYLKNTEFRMGDYPIWLYFSMVSRISFVSGCTTVYRVIGGSSSHRGYLSQIRMFESEYDVKQFFMARFSVPDDVVKEAEIRFSRKMLRPAFLAGDKQKIQSCCDILDRLGYKPAFIEKLYCCSRAYFLTFPLLSLFHMLINSWKRIRK